jgi:hypothetical protein
VHGTGGGGGGGSMSVSTPSGSGPQRPATSSGSQRHGLLFYRPPPHCPAAHAPHDVMNSIAVCIHPRLWLRGGMQHIVPRNAQCASSDDAAAKVRRRLRCDHTQQRNAGHVPAACDAPPPTCRQHGMHTPSTAWQPPAPAAAQWTTQSWVMIDVLLTLRSAEE